MTGIEIIVNAIDNASKIIEGIGNKSEKVAKTLEKNWLKVTIATAAAGVAIEAIARKQGTLTEQTKKVAASLNMQENEVRKLVLSLSNVSTPIERVLALMELGRQQGLKAIKQLEEYVDFWDMVADATGEAAEVLAEAGISLHSVGIVAGEEGRALSAFGYIAQETTSSISEFLQFLQMTGPELRAMGIDINNTAAILGILEQEFGLTGARGIATFRQAVNEADGDLNKMLSLLGISKETFDEYSKAVENSSEVIANNAKIHEESFTILQKLQSFAADLVYKYGDLITVISTLTPLLITIGPIIKGIAVAKHLWAIAMEHLTTAFAAFNIVSLPMSVVILAIAAAITQLIIQIFELTDAITKSLAGLQSWKELLYMLIPVAGPTVYAIRRAMGITGIPAEAAGGAGGNWQYGGTIPGPIGQPRLAIVHGGEEINNPYMGGYDSRGTQIIVENKFDMRGMIIREETDIDEITEDIAIKVKQKLAGVGVR